MAFVARACAMFQRQAELLMTIISFSFAHVLMFTEHVLEGLRGCFM